MNFPFKNKIVNQIIWFGSVISLSLFILYISIVLSGLNTISSEINKRNVKVNPISVNKFNSNGEIEVINYKLPVAGLLPTNPLYILKRGRAYLWVKLSNDLASKSRTALFIADKKMSETLMLIEKNKIDLAIKTSIEGVDKLKYADKLAVQLNKESEDYQQITRGIFEASFIYKEIINRIESENEANKKICEQIIKDLNVIGNEEKEENISKY